MSCFFTPEARKEKHKKKDVKKILKEGKRNYRDQIKLLILGTGESGKSTFIRQMRIIHGDGFSEEEKKSGVKVIMRIILTSMQNMICAMERLNIDYQSIANVRYVHLIKNADHETFDKEFQLYISTIKELWKDAGIQECYRRRREYQLIDSCKYYLDNIDRIGDPLYRPTNDDMLHLRIPTTGLVEYHFNVSKVPFLMVDVAGQRTERKKWLNCFDKVKAIIFLTAISEYDQFEESIDMNRLVESTIIFDTITHYEWFARTSIILFLNKIDLLKEKIMYSDLGKYFPTFMGPKQDATAAQQFIEKMFVQKVPKRNVYKHFTCATDTENIRHVFDDVRHSVLTDALNRFGVF